MVRVVAGNDSIVGGFGARITGDIEVTGQTPGSSVAADLTYRISSGRADGYVGAGAGYNLGRESTFGDLLVGGDYRVTDSIAVFAEARQNYFFDGTNDSIGSIVGGLKFRF